MMKRNRSHGERMKRFMTVLLAAFIMLMAAAATAYAEEDEGNEADETETGSEDSAEDEKESTPGFEVAFAAAAALTAARLLKARLL
jgi:hypothetical protein